MHCSVPAATCLEFIPDGSSLVVAAREGVVQLVKLDSECPQLLGAVEPSAGCIAVLLYS